MEVGITTETGIMIATPTGRIEGSNAKAFQKSVENAMEGEENALVLDFNNLSYISSAGLRCIAIMINMTKAKGMNIAICSPSRPVQDVLVTSGFNQLVKILETKDEALNAVAD